MNTYDEITAHSKSPIKRYSHNRRFELGAKLCGESNSVFDYGTGTGFFLKVLSEKNPNARLVGYEPLTEMFSVAQAEMKNYNSVRIVNSLEELGLFDCITCFEVLEHLTEEDQIKTLRECKKRLSVNGKLIISVPIETGIAGLAKNIVRWIIGQPHATTFSEVWRSFLGLKINRKAEGSYIFSHIGFQYGDIEKIFHTEQLTIRAKIFSPLSLLGPALNSQIFYVLDAKE